MTCDTCHSELPDSMRFCPSCGSLGSSADVSPDTRVMAAGDPPASAPADRRAGGTSARARLRGAEPHRAAPVGSAADADLSSSTSVLAPDPGADRAGHRDGPSVGDRVAPAAREARQQARRWADRFSALPVDLRIALVGTAVTVLSFLAFDYAVGLEEPVDIAGRLWLIPIAAVGATALLYGSLRRGAPAAASDEVPRRTDGLLAAVVIAAAGAVEAGLIGLLTGDVVGPRGGFYGMLLGLVLVLVACVRAARRTLR
ncbi:MAG TPA: hypothetical protein VNB94_04095 [Mycobacteriales bacterium]|nr:hypothetical protein [Mycobacteriales bacterium]